MAPKITGVHLCGSFPPDFKNTEEVMTTICEALPASGRLKRIPDGETGERHYFVGWQSRIIAKQPQVLNQNIRKHVGIKDGELPALSEEEMKRIVREIEDEGGLDTEYDRAGLEGYAEFVRLREAGVVPKGVRFQVGLPSPLTVVTLFIREDMRALYEPVYERAILKAARNLQDHIPTEDLAIQWDCPMEFAILEKSSFEGENERNVLEHVGSFWDGGDLEGIVERCSRLVDSIDEGVEVGLHLCYGNSGNKHFVEPKDMTWLAKVADGVCYQSQRRLDFIHMPVPIERTDVQYFEPLRLLEGKLDSTELSLGLVHAHDLEGTRKRMDAAAQIVSSFSVSGECGMGRTTRDNALDVLKASAEVCPGNS